jgi:PST family polysaccharide transporter
LLRLELAIKKQIKSNFGWLAFDKTLAIFHSLVVGAMVAKYLEPSKFGILANAMAIGAIMRPLVSLGSDQVVTRRFIHEDERAGLYWTMFCARIALGLVACIAIFLCLYSGLIKLSDQTEAWVIIITTVPLIFSGFELSTLLLRADLLNKYGVIGINVVLLFVSAAKILLIYMGMDIVWFAAMNACNAALASIVTYLVSQRLGLVPAFEFPKKEIFLGVVRECWPLIISSLSVVLYMNIDCLMLRAMDSSREAGIYAAAVRLSMVWYFLPVVLGTSFLPWLTKIYHDRPDHYRAALRRYFEINALLSYACVLVAFFTFPILINLLFGPQYHESLAVFQVHIFGVIFVFMGTARAQHLNLTKMHVFNMASTLLGLIINIVLNFYLIPLYSSYGAAISTVISFSVSAYLSSFLFPKLSSIAMLQTTSWLASPFKSYFILKELIHSR